MGGLIGVGAAMAGLGNAAIVVSAVIGGVVFSIAAPRAGRTD